MIFSNQAINHLLATISLRIRQSLDVEEILQITVQEVCWLLKCDRVIIYRLEPNWAGKVTVEAVSDNKWSILGEEIRDRCFESSLVDKYLQGEATYYEDINQAGIKECHREFLANFQVQAYLVAAILQPQSTTKEVSDQQSNHQYQESEITISKNTRLWGFLIAHQCQYPRKWQEAEINLFKQLANQVAIALQQAELLQRTNQELREKKLAERQTQQVRQFLQTVIDSLPIAVYVKGARQDNFGKFQLWNKATENLFKVDALQALGKTVYDYFPSKQAESCVQQDLKVLQTGRTLDITEEHLHTENNRTKIVHKTKVPLYSQDQEPEYLLCIAEDITARKEAELELRRKSEELTEFSHNLKLLHRLNTTNYQSFADLFRDHLQTGCQMFNCST